MNVTNQHKLADRRLVRGQGMTEYIIIVALIAIAAIAAVSGFGGVVSKQFEGMANSLAGQDGGAAVTEAGQAADAAVGGTKTLSDYAQ